MNPKDPRINVLQVENEDGSSIRYQVECYNDPEKNYAKTTRGFYDFDEFVDYVNKYNQRGFAITSELDETKLEKAVAEEGTDRVMIGHMYYRRLNIET